MRSGKEGVGVRHFVTTGHKCMTEGGGGWLKMSNLCFVIMNAPLPYF